MENQTKIGIGAGALLLILGLLEPHLSRTAAVLIYGALGLVVIWGFSPLFARLWPQKTIEDKSRPNSFGTISGTISGDVAAKAMKGEKLSEPALVPTRFIANPIDRILSLIPFFSQKAKQRIDFKKSWYDFNTKVRETMSLEAAAQLAYSETRKTMAAKMAEAKGRNGNEILQWYGFFLLDKWKLPVWGIRDPSTKEELIEWVDHQYSLEGEARWWFLKDRNSNDKFNSLIVRKSDVLSAIEKIKAWPGES